MEFETADKAALRLGVTVRAVQKWAKEGKIPNSHKIGRDWMIPTDAKKPISPKRKTSPDTENGRALENRIETKTEKIEKKHYHAKLFPSLYTYNKGHFLEDIESLTNEDERAMAFCEYYYMTGDLRECTIIAEPYLDSESPVFRFMSGQFCIFSNLSRGRLNKTYYASQVMRETLDKCIENNASKEIIAIGIMTILSAKIKLHLPVDGLPSLRDNIKYIEGGVRLYACYLLAYCEYQEKEYSKALGVVETALCLSKEICPLPMTYLYIVAAMAHINLHHKEQAMKSIEKAFELASPDGIIMPFVEHYNLLQGLMESGFKIEHPQFYNKIISLSKQYNSSWYQVYNERSPYTVATNLTNTEFTIAMLYSRNWRVKEIASHMHLSERTVTNYISYIYDKLHINSKKDLEKFMLK